VLTTRGCTAPAVLSSQSCRAIKSIAVSDVIHFLLNFDLFFQLELSIPNAITDIRQGPPQSERQINFRTSCEIPREGGKMYFPLLLFNWGHTPLSPKVDKSAIVVPGDLPVWDCDSSVAVLIHRRGRAKNSRGSEWVRLRTDFQSRAN
jgi:hypothetical protein